MRMIGITAYIFALTFTTLAGAQGLGLKQPLTLAQYVYSLDWSSALMAGLISLLGGSARTAMSLFREGQTIPSAFRETVKDGVVALVTGGVCFVILAALAVFYTIAPPLQAAFIFLAGLARGKFIGWLDATFARALDLAFDVGTSWLRKRAAETEKDITQ